MLLENRSDNMESYKELDIATRQKGTSIEDLSWTDKFIIRYVDFFRLVFVASMLGLIILLLM